MDDSLCVSSKTHRYGTAIDQSLCSGFRVFYTFCARRVPLLIPPGVAKVAWGAILIVFVGQGIVPLPRSQHKRSVPREVNGYDRSRGPLINAWCWTETKYDAITNSRVTPKDDNIDTQLTCPSGKSYKVSLNDYFVWNTCGISPNTLHNVLEYRNECMCRIIIYFVRVNNTISILPYILQAFPWKYCTYKVRNALYQVAQPS